MGFVATFAKGAEGAISGRGGAWKGCTGCSGRAAWKPPGRKGLGLGLAFLLPRKFDMEKLERNLFLLGTPQKKNRESKLKTHKSEGSCHC